VLNPKAWGAAVFWSIFGLNSPSSDKYSIPIALPAQRIELVNNLVTKQFALFNPFRTSPVHNYEGRSSVMKFEFIVKNRSGKKSKVRVVAEREVLARRSLERSGYEVIALVGVDAEEVGALVFHRNSRTNRSSSLGEELQLMPSENLRRKLRLVSIISDFFSPFNLMG
jgi:hypothetical protein